MIARRRPYISCSNLLRAKVFLIEVSANKDFENREAYGPGAAEYVPKCYCRGFDRMLAAAFIGHLLREFYGDQTNRKLALFCPPERAYREAFGSRKQFA